MADYDFIQGQLIVPNDDIAAAFIYDAVNTELMEGVEYRVATSAEFIWWNKYRKMKPMNGGLESYKKSMSEEVGKVYKSIENEKSNQRKQGLS